MVAPLFPSSGRAPFPPLAFRAALALALLLLLAGPAWAQAVKPVRVSIAKTVVAASGIRVPTRFEAELRCTSPSGPTQVRVPLAGGRPVLSLVPVGSECVVVERPVPVPAGNAACPFPAWAAPQYSPSANFTVPQSGAVTRIVITNRLICTRPGRLILVKRTNPAPGIPSLAPLFLVRCGPSGPNSRVAIPASGQAAVSGIAAGSLCTVTEQFPRSRVPNCAWTPSQSPPGSVPIPSGANVTVTVTNDWVCKPGNLVIAKTTAAPGVTLPAQIPFSVNCGPGRPAATVMVPSNGSSTPLAIPAPAACTVVEQTPSAPAGCSWTSTQSPSGRVDIAAGATVTVTVTNKLTCQAQPGGLIIRKTFQVNLASINLQWLPSEISFNVKCTPAGPTATISVPLNGDSVALAVPASSTCTLVEQFPPGPAECSWRVTQVPPGNVTIPAGPPVVVVVDNILFCFPPGEIRIEQSTAVPPGRAIPESFDFDVTCAGFRSGVWKVPANGTSARIAIPPPRACSVTQSIPPAPPDCRWTTTPSPPVGVDVRTGEISRVVVVNRLDCS